MSDIITATNVANRALQRVGAERIADGALFTEDSKNAAECRACYDILRRAELRRNVWRFSIRRAPLRPVDVTSFLYVPATWSASVPYPAGGIVQYNGTWYESLIAANLNQTPADDSSAWTRYFGPNMVSQWDSTNTTSYYQSELVYTPSTTGFVVYRAMSRILNSPVTPPTVTPPAWDATLLYQIGDFVTGSDAHVYVALTSLNINLDPATAANALYWVRQDVASASAWSAVTTYAAAALVQGSDGNFYESRAAGNLNHNPVTTTGFWNYVPAAQTQKPIPQSLVTTPATTATWMVMDGTMLPININYPAATGPSGWCYADFRSIYLFPQGYLRTAPQSPTAGYLSILGFPGNLPMNDWTTENKFFVSRDTGVIVFRFAADITNAAEFDPMFVEGLGARIAMEVCEPLTQSDGKLSAIMTEYKLIMGEARIVNGIETAPNMPPLDDFIQCRI